MARKATGWTCKKASCRAKNPPRTRKCQTCGKPRPAKKVPAHARVLTEMSYEDFIILNEGDLCWICGKPPSATRRLDRDHDHKTGKARGLLCHRCNRQLKDWVTPGWLRRAAVYLDNAKENIGI